MNKDRFFHLEQVFNTLVDMAPDRRQAWLLEHEADPAVRMQLQRMLDHAASNGDADADALQVRLHALHALALDQALPGRVDSYRLVRELGRGGMGTVHLAEREVEGVVQQVAIKLLSALQGSGERQRLAQEHALLAALHHPHIARLIDAGQTGDGRPYLVMGYVDGLPLSEYIQHARPSLEARLHLFLQCCDAVQYAHQRLVLHRDIKPSNILVSADGTPVLLDFGVGKLLQADMDNPHTGVGAFTPGYAAPEQMHGGQAGMTTDVFGLGALLFDILSGSRLSVHRRGDVPVPAPSLHAEDEGMRRRLRGDLDRIVAKACASQPADRYQTVTALAEDVRRHQAGEPLAAGPGTVMYRLRRFVARHRVASAALALIVVLLGLFVWRLQSERDRALRAEQLAQREATDAGAARDFLVSVLSAADPEQLQGRALSVDMLLESATARLRGRHALDTQAQAQSWLAIATIQDTLKRPRETLAAVAQANGMLAGKKPVDLQVRARILELRGSALVALSQYDAAIAQLRALVELRDRAPADALERARAYRALGNALAGAEQLEEADAQLKHALSLAALVPQPARDAFTFALLLDTIDVLALRGLVDQASRVLDRAMDVGRRNLPADDVQWARLFRLSGDVRLMQGRYREALDDTRHALDVTVRVYGQRSRRVVEYKRLLAGVMSQMGDTPAAVRQLEQALDLARSLGLGGIVIAELNVEVGTQMVTRGECRRAVQLLDEAIQVFAGLPAQRLWSNAAYTQRALANVGLARFEQAWPDFDRAAQLSTREGPNAYEYSTVQARRARALLRAGRVTESRAALEDAWRINRALDIADDSLAGIVIQITDAQQRQASGEHAAAVASANKALAAARARGNDMPALLGASVHLAAARIFAEQHQPGLARGLLQQAAPELEQRLVPGALDLQDLHALQARLRGGKE